MSGPGQFGKIDCISTSALKLIQFIWAAANRSRFKTKKIVKDCCLSLEIASGSFGDNKFERVKVFEREEDEEAKDNLFIYVCSDGQPNWRALPTTFE